KPGENNFFLLKHSVGAFLYNSEIDTPLDYADYYYLEALKKYAAIKKITI
ncbi:MAG: glucuronyl hydrolase, partial [Flavobacterium sp.]